MNPLSSILLGFGLGIVFSIPPGAAGAIILNLALRGAQKQAARALGAFLLAELLVMGVGFLCFGQLAALAALPLIKPAAGIYLLGFALMAWRAAGTERGFTATSSWGVFRLTLLNPAIWIGAVSMLTIARTSGGPGVLPALCFIAGLEGGSVAWYLSVILGARYIPSRRRQHLERAAVLLIGATGVWFILAAIDPKPFGGRLESFFKGCSL